MPPLPGLKETANLLCFGLVRGWLVLICDRRSRGVQFSISEPHREREWRISERSRATTLVLPLRYEFLLPSAKADDVTSLIKYDEQQRLAVLRARLPDKRADAAI